MNHFTVLRAEQLPGETERSEAEGASSTPKPQCVERSGRASLSTMTVSNTECQEVQEEVVEVRLDSQYTREGPSLTSTSSGEWTTSPGTYAPTLA